jgi:hypothetical protein
MTRRLLAAALLSATVLALGACADPRATASSPPSEPIAWDDRAPVVYSVLVAEVLDDLGTPPPVVIVVDGVCEEAGQVEPSELACSGSIPRDAKAALQGQLERYVAVEFVPSAEAALADDGSVRDGGLLFWLGPLEDRKGGEVRVGATYGDRLTDEDALGVNLAVESRSGSWIVTGAAGLGGCPA